MQSEVEGRAWRLQIFDFSAEIAELHGHHTKFWICLRRSSSIILTQSLELVFGAPVAPLHRAYVQVSPKLR